MHACMKACVNVLGHMHMLTGATCVLCMRASCLCTYICGQKGSLDCRREMSV